MVSTSKCPTMLEEVLKTLMPQTLVMLSKIISSPSGRPQDSSLPSNKKIKIKSTLFLCINIPIAMALEVHNSLFLGRWMGAPKELALPCRDINEDPLIAVILN